MPLPSKVEPTSELGRRWADLHPEDQAVAALALDVLADEAQNFGEWVRFFDLVLDLRPALERRILSMDQIRAAALALIEDERVPPEL